MDHKTNDNNTPKEESENLLKLLYNDVTALAELHVFVEFLIFTSARLDNDHDAPEASGMVDAARMCLKEALETVGRRHIQTSKQLAQLGEAEHIKKTKAMFGTFANEFFHDVEHAHARCVVASPTYGEG